MDRIEYRTALRAARAGLVEAGYSGPGEHGPGDPEVNAIDRAINIDLLLGNIVFNVQQSPERHSTPEVLDNIRSVIGLRPGERP